jgi:hypothetical protein
MAENRVGENGQEAGPLLLGIYALLNQCLEPYAGLVGRLVADGRLSAVERDAVAMEVHRRIGVFEDAVVKQILDIQPHEE